MSQISTKWIANNAVTVAKIQQLGANTILGNNTGSTGNAIALSTSQVQTLLAIPTSGSPLSLAAGGTGISAGSANAAFNALSPMTTLGDLIYGGASGIGTRLGIGSTGQVLTVSGGIPSWASPATSGTVTSVAFSDGSTTPIYAVSGSPVTSSGTLTITLDTQSANKVFAGPSSGSAAQPTFRSLVANDIPSLSSIYLPLAGGTMSGSINGGGFEALNFATPTASSSLATKGYVDAAISGLTWKGPAQAYSTSDTPLTGSTPLVIDGYTVQDGDLIILAGQTIASQDGEYSVAITGGSYALTANGLPNAIGDAWLIMNGTLYGNSAFVATSAVPTATFVEFAGPNAYTFSAPLSLSGNTVSITQATTSTDGYLSSTDWNTFNNKQAAGNYITALTGDVTASGPGSAAATLATVNSNVGSFGSSTSIPSFTVNAKGLITAASGNAVVAPAGTLSGTTLNSSVVSSSLTSVGTITSGTWNGTTIAIANGGTGQTSASAAFAALSPLTTAGDIIYENSTPAPARLGIGSTGQVLTVVGGLPAWSTASSVPTNGKDTFVLSSTDITNQYVTLSHTPLANSTDFLVVGGGDQLEGSSYDYTVSGATIVFQNGLATGGVSALVSGDVLQIAYEY